VPFIYTTTKDDRVGPQHAPKFAARVEEYGLPFLYYENTEGGHAAGANLRQVAHTSALEMVYLTRRLMDPQEPPAPALTPPSTVAN
jgi:prolyl oligopeptidase